MEKHDRRFRRFHVENVTYDARRLRLAGRGGVSRDEGNAKKNNKEKMAYFSEGKALPLHLSRGAALR
ncbi:MAG: hypothetical protein IPO54_04120 [Micavibrio sp.]|nr:hypothetical protein [Micavibrio sp.]